MDLTRAFPDVAVRLALSMGAVALFTLAIVWSVQGAGYVPCDLCLLERDPFYLAVPLGLATAGAAGAGWRRLTLAGFAGLALLFLASAALAAYHAGVEWQFWAGPSGCTGAMTAPAAVNDFLHQLDTVKVVRCDAAAMRLFGVSLAGWNVVASLVLFVVACSGLRAARRQVEPMAEGLDRQRPRSRTTAAQ